jgi:hypothetical protein
MFDLWSFNEISYSLFDTGINTGFVTAGSTPSGDFCSLIDEGV